MQEHAGGVDVGERGFASLYPSYIAMSNGASVTFSNSSNARPGTISRTAKLPSVTSSTARLVLTRLTQAAAISKQQFYAQSTGWLVTVPMWMLDVFFGVRDMS